MLVSERQPRPFGHESTAIATERVLWVGAAIAALVLVIIVVLYQVVQRDMIPRIARLAAKAAALPPAPRLQAHPHSDLVTSQQQEEALLSGYAWIDSSHRIARIPIERAMAIYAAEQAQKSPAAAATGPAATMQERLQ
jgi:hypothetical protein